MAEEVQVVLHHGTVLPCEAQGFPRPSITWQREGVSIATGDDHIRTGKISVLFLLARNSFITNHCLESGDARNQYLTRVVWSDSGHRLSVLSNGALKFSRVTLGDAGMYQCLAKNEAGVAVGRTRLVLQGNVTFQSERKWVFL